MGKECLSAADRVLLTNLRKTAEKVTRGFPEEEALELLDIYYAWRNALTRRQARRAQADTSAIQPSAFE